MDFYNWPEDRITTDDMRMWMKEEKDKIRDSEAKGFSVNANRKRLVYRCFALMLGGGRPLRPADPDDPGALFDPQSEPLLRWE